ncbi:FtsB family cell division protein [Yinghuangia seranimata]|uniref:FtsB family cell division protein n=1 Tax=Yinghuangia seranimata TaxID=408067 RepID=UPI00248BA1C4|nr:septum formation initiator family protein [Yinghuangia seranimata]MDI2128798.1 septum formation initiator family protein [Yinghuangia seranimata]
MSEAGGRNGNGDGGAPRPRAAAPRPAARPRPGGGPAAARPKPKPKPKSDPAAKRRRLVITWGGGKGRPNRLTGRAGVLVLVVCTLGVALIVPARQYLDQRREREDLREETAKRREEVERLRLELERWKDPAFVRQQARLYLHYVNPGDTAYSVVPPPAPASASPGATPSPGSWPSQLWTSVRDADTGPKKPSVPPPPPAPAATIVDPRTGGR